MKKEILIEIMSQERNSLRVEVIEFQKSLHKANFAFITVAVAVGGIFFGEPFSLEEDARAILLFSLSQVEFIIALFCTSIMNNIFSHSGYLATLDDNINKLAGRVISLWETEIYTKFVWGIKSTFFWNIVILALYYALLFISLFVITIASVDSYSNVFTIILVTELLIITVLYPASYIERRRVRIHSKNLLKETQD